MRKRLRRLFTLQAIPGWLLILWKIITEVETLTSVFLWLSPVWAFVNSQNGTIVVLLLGFGILVYLLVKPENKQNTLSNEQLATEMKAELRKDSDNFARSIFIHNIKINWNGLLETDSYFTIDCDIYSSSVYRLDIGKKYEGHLYWESEAMERAIEVIIPIEDLARSFTKHLRLRQWVSPPRMNRIGLEGGREVNLIFGDVKIRVEGKLPGRPLSLISRLPIQDKLQVRIPTRVELENR